MNFLAKTFTSLTGTAIPYNFGEKLQFDSIWTSYSGSSQKDDKIKVTIFEFNLREPRNTSLVDLARNCYKKSKLIKFPGIIQIIDYIENDNFLYVITEPVVPLVSYLQSNSDTIDDSIKIFGVYSIAKTLTFINKDANCLHGNLNSNSIFVNDCGDWKIWGFELMTNLTSDPEQPIYRSSHRCPSFSQNSPPEVVDGGVEAIRKMPFKFDSYRFGVVMSNLFNNGASNLQDFTRIPKSILPGYKRLISQFGVRVTIENFFRNGEQTFFKANKLIEFANELSELSYKSDTEKFSFMNNLARLSINLPPGFIEFKILPELILQFNNVLNTKIPLEEEENRIWQQEQVSMMLSQILKFGEKLSDENFSFFLKPVFLKAFTLPDRAVRLILLNSLPIFITKLNKMDVQDRIFSNLITGFQDTNVTIREETVKSMILVADKLTDRQLNNDLLRYLAKSQIDPQASIRTNTIIVISNIAPYLNKSSRANVLITALSKSLKDSFTPCKLNALLAFNACIDYFNPELCCTKILGAICFCLLDKNTKVRNEAKVCFDKYMDKITEAAASLPVVDDIEEELEQNSEVSSTKKDAFGLGWNVVTKLANNIGGQLNSEFNNSTPDLTRNTSPRTTTPSNSTSQQKVTYPEEQKNSNFNFANLNIEDDIDLEYDWTKEDFFEEEEIKASSANERKQKNPSVIKPAFGASKAINKNLPKKSLQKPSALSLKKKTIPGSTLKLNLTVDDAADDWGNSEW